MHTTIWNALLLRDVHGERCQIASACVHTTSRCMGLVPGNLTVQCTPGLAPQVWSLLFQRLQAAKTARFVRGFLVLLAHFVAAHGPAALSASMDAVQPGILLVILQQVRAWAPHGQRCSAAEAGPAPTWMSWVPGCR